MARKLINLSNEELAVPVKLKRLPTLGDIDKARIAVVCDAPSQKSWDKRLPISDGALNLFASTATECDFKKDDFFFIAPCPPIPEEIEKNERRIAAHALPYQEQVKSIIEDMQPDLIIFMGKWGGRVLTGKSVKITKARGTFTSVNVAGTDYPVLPMLSPGHVYHRPELKDIFVTDFMMAMRLRDRKYNLAAVQADISDTKDYRWCTDLSELLASPPKMISVDTETTGLKWWTAGTDDPDAVKILTVQIGLGKGRALVVPMDCDYYPELTPKKRSKLLGQLRKLLENPKIRKAGHNFKYDTHVLREDLKIYIDYDCDTQLLAFVVDENMQEKSLDECVRRWVPRLAGYNDELNKKLDKENMRSASHEDMLEYGGGDVDATFDLALILTKLGKKDARQWNCYQRIILPAIKAFCDPVELYGVRVNTKVLTDLERELAIAEREQYDTLIEQVPAAIKRKHADKGLKFSRAAFLVDILFTKQGLNLKPRVFTASTAKLPEDQRIPSVSAKQHLPFFIENPFVAQLSEYVKLEKLRSTYVGVPYDEKKKGPTGFWQYIYNNEIHPSFILHRTVTGRAASVNPNGQNFPKRGKLAKTYRKIFVARKGYKFIEVDLSQAELRIAAWMANEKNMIRIYKAGGDIHAATAAHTMGLTIEQFNALDKDTRKAKRQQAKAINFGYVFGMWWRKFKIYAKTDYGVDFTDEEAQKSREDFFTLYPGLAEWQEEMKDQVNKYGYVRALHGAVRHLPSVYSPEDYIKQEAQRQAVNSPVQRFASDLGLMAMIRLTRDADPEVIRPLLFVHDALVVEVKEEFAEQAQGWVKYYFESAPLEKWFGIVPPLPIVADVATGYNLGEMEECEGVKAVKPPFAGVD